MNCKASRFVDNLEPGQPIVIETHFFPKNDGEDAILFVSEELMVVEINKEELIVTDEKGIMTCIPVENFKTYRQKEVRCIKSPVKEVRFYIYAFFSDIGQAIVDKIDCKEKQQ